MSRKSSRQRLRQPKMLSHVATGRMLSYIRLRSWAKACRKVLHRGIRPSNGPKVSLASALSMSAAKLATRVKPPGVQEHKRKKPMSNWTMSTSWRLMPLSLSKYSFAGSCLQSSRSPTALLDARPQMPMRATATACWLMPSSPRPLSTHERVKLQRCSAHHWPTVSFIALSAPPHLPTFAQRRKGASFEGSKSKKAVSIAAARSASESCVDSSKHRFNNWKLKLPQLSSSSFLPLVRMAETKEIKNLHR
mmetsp:Transcript_40505/g.80566  ORF Transcript_40505/g.80566 Transcript_40505/m.80566 type:complete len:249 (-) Transcript_40505:836-1582(-)